MTAEQWDIVNTLVILLGFLAWGGAGYAWGVHHERTRPRHRYRRKQR